MIIVKTEANSSTATKLVNTAVTTNGIYRAVTG